MTAEPRLFPALGLDDGAPRRLSYLDTATTSLMPRPVIEAVAEALSRGGSAGRSVHSLGLRATEQYERARGVVARHLGVDAPQIVFVRSATEGLNLVAEGWARPRLGPGDEVCVSAAEHHSNLLPWRRICDQRGARLSIVECDAQGDLDLDALRRRLSHRTQVLAITHVSNVTGAQTSIAEVARVLAASPAAAAALVVDGSQAVPHLRVDLASQGCDFYVLSGHKAYGPPGIGVVWGKPERWSETRPLLVGGGMVTRVGADSIDYADGPARFEGGTPNVPGAIGLAAGLEFLREHHDLPREQALLGAVERVLAPLPSVRVLGAPRRRTGAISFVVQGVHPHDVATVLDGYGVAVRAGHHCAQPLLEHFGVASAVRVSVGLHNDEQDIDRLATGLAGLGQALAPTRRSR